MQQLSERALNEMTVARSILIMGHVFFGCLALHLKLVETSQISTMATDGEHLFYNPKFVMELKQSFIVAIIAHEILHCAYRHHLRMGNRDPRKWNEATDYIINLDLIKAGFKLPSWVLYNSKYDGMSSEEVYALLPDKPNQPKADSSQPKAGGQKGSQGKGGDGPIEAPDPGKMGGVIAPVAPDQKASIEEREMQWRAKVGQAVNIAKAQNAGNIPGYLDRLIQDMKTPKVNWEILRSFIDQSVIKDHCWMRPNRRFLHRGIILPGQVSDSLNRVVSVMDTSGSITDELVNQYAGEKRAILDEGLTDNLTVIYNDTQVRHIEEFQRGDILKLNPRGGGGTNFRHSFDFIKKNYPDTSVVLYFTDLMTMDFGEDPGFPVLWVVYGPRQAAEQRANKVPFGESICVSL